VLPRTLLCDQSALRALNLGAHVKPGDHALYSDPGPYACEVCFRAAHVATTASASGSDSSGLKLLEVVQLLPAQQHRDGFPFDGYNILDARSAMYVCEQHARAVPLELEQLEARHRAATQQHAMKHAMKLAGGPPSAAAAAALSAIAPQRQTVSDLLSWCRQTATAVGEAGGAATFGPELHAHYGSNFNVCFALYGESDAAATAAGSTPRAARLQYSTASHYSPIPINHAANALLPTLPLPPLFAPAAAAEAAMQQHGKTRAPGAAMPSNPLPAATAASAASAVADASATTEASSSSRRPTARSRMRDAQLQAAVADVSASAAGAHGPTRALTAASDAAATAPAAAAGIPVTSSPVAAAAAVHAEASVAGPSAAGASASPAAVPIPASLQLLPVQPAAAASLESTVTLTDGKLHGRVAAWEVQCTSIQTGCRIEGFDVSSHFFLEQDRALAFAHAKAKADWVDHRMQDEGGDDDDDGEEEEEEDVDAFEPAPDGSYLREDASYGLPELAITVRPTHIDFDAANGIVLETAESQGT